MVAASKPLVEKFGSLNLQLGGTNGYVGVRKCKKGGYQGYTPKKSKGHFTGRYETAQEAAVATRAISCFFMAMATAASCAVSYRPVVWPFDFFGV